jgi:hypothetical protein
LVLTAATVPFDRRVRRQGDFVAPSHGNDPFVVYENRRLRHRRRPGAVDQRAAEQGGQRLREGQRSGEPFAELFVQDLCSSVDASVWIPASTDRVLLGA